MAWIRGTPYDLGNLTDMEDLEDVILPAFFVNN